MTERKRASDYPQELLPRYDEAAATLAWNRTLAFFNKYLR